MTILCMLLYRLIERIDGEKWAKLISYVIAEKVKLFLLYHIK